MRKNPFSLIKYERKEKKKTIYLQREKRRNSSIGRTFFSTTNEQK
jgi:hypothetical protein